MKFLKKIFGSKVQNSNKPIGTSKDKVNSKLEGSKISAKYFEKDVIGCISGSVVFSHGWNDPSEIIPEETAMILDVVESREDIETKLNYWNKIYYNQITQHYSITQEQLESISEIINVPSNKYRELYAHWPDSIDENIYKSIYDKLNLKFVQYNPIKDKNKGKYLIKINEEFWNIKTHNSLVLVDIINTYERNFKDFELVHSSYEIAMNYGIIIMDRLCNQRGPDNSYYYEQAIKQQNKSFQKLPIFNYNSLKYKEEEVKSEYGRIINEMKSELKLMNYVIESLYCKPFEIIKVNDDD